MNILKKMGLLFGILMVASLNIFVYLNSHLYYRATREEDTEKRIDFLEKSNKYCPLNDLAFYELGKAYLDLGLQTLSDAPASIANLQKAVQSLKQSIRINPASPFAHFYLGQALLQLDVFAPGQGEGSIGEFKTALRLTGEDSRLFLEVTRIFLSRWPRLSAEDREFTIGILKRTMAKSNPDQIVTLLNTWEMNALDYAIMNEALPPDPQILRTYARFLGEKSLSLEERQNALARSELLEYDRAQSEHRLGEFYLFNFRLAEASRHFRAALNLLNSIRFYQALRPLNPINTGEFTQLLKSTLLNLAKCRLEERAGLDEVAQYLHPYLALEDQPKEISDLETYLRERGILPARFNRTFDDPGQLAFELLLQYKQTRYRDIAGLGRELERSFVVVSGEKKTEYVRILQLIGDSYQKIDFNYDAGDIYLRALDADPGNLETLFRLRQNYDRLSDEQKVRDIDVAIGKIIAPSEIMFLDRVLNKEQVFSQPLIFDGRRIAIDLEFGSEGGWGNDGGGLIPLISIFFNGRVVWEDYLEDKAASFVVETKVGSNGLQIVAVNRAVSLVKLSWRSE